MPCPATGKVFTTAAADWPPRVFRAEPQASLLTGIAIKDIQPAANLMVTLLFIMFVLFMFMIVNLTSVIITPAEMETMSWGRRGAICC